MMNAFKTASNVLALLGCKVAEEAEKLAGGKDKYKIWGYRARQMRDIYEATLTGRTVVLLQGYQCNFSEHHHEWLWVLRLSAKHVSAHSCQ